MAHRISKDGTRLATDEASLIGIACYEGAVKDGEFEGDFAFNCGDIPAAERWVETGAAPARVIRIPPRG